MGEMQTPIGGETGIRGALRGAFRRVTSVREAALITFILFISLVLGVTTPNFVSTQNILSTLTGLALDAVIATGMAVVMVSGGIDLSVGSVFACSSIVVAKMINLGLPVLAAVAIGIVTALFWGTINGLLITRVGLNSLISTLGTMGMARGLVYVITSGRILSNLPASFEAVGQGAFLGVPNVIWLALVVIAVGDLLLRRSRVMRQFFYLGGNEKAARLSGLNINRLKMGAYILIALLAGLAGIFETSRFGSAMAPMGTNKELTAISACVIGGASMSGGEGSVVGAFLGLILLGLVRDGLILNDVSVYWQGLIQAAILVAAVSFDVLTRRRRNRAP
jgi:ribose transport system permease protein